MVSDSLKQVKNLILASGADDWVDIGIPLFTARELLGGVGEPEALPLVITAIKELLREGLVEVGRLGSAGFEAWSGPLGRIEERLDLEARKVEFPIPMSSICWIANTSRGDEIGQEIARTEPEIFDDE